MNIPPEMILEYKFAGIAAKLNPTVFQDEDNYCILYGSSPSAGIYGCGKSIEEALLDWENNLQLALSNDLDIKKILSDRNPPEKVAEFLEDYRSRAKKDTTGYDQNKSF